VLPRRCVQCRGPVPIAFQGLGEDGLKMLRATGDGFNMPVVTEVMDPRQVSWSSGTRTSSRSARGNMQNFDLLKEVGRTRTPVLLKRGIARRQGPPDVGRIRPGAGTAG